MLRRKGTIIEWNDDRGFGFLRPERGGDRVFCHIKSFRGLAQRPARGQVFSYQLAQSMGGRQRARDIRPLDYVAPAAATAATSSTAVSAYVGCLVFLGVVTALVYLGRLPWLVLPWYAGLSLVTFLLYARMRRSARNALALAGGWPGGWIAQQGLRPPSWAAVALHLLVLGALAYGGPDAWGVAVPDAQHRSYKAP